MLFVAKVVQLPKPHIASDGGPVSQIFWLKPTNPQLRVVSFRIVIDYDIHASSVFLGWVEYESRATLEDRAGVYYRESVDAENGALAIECRRDGAKTFPIDKPSDVMSSKKFSSVPENHVAIFGADYWNWRLTDVVLGRVEELANGKDSKDSDNESIA